ncbi:MAG: hypothetical protein ACHQO8_02365 [Vicinamibacterales bacterium]
MAGRSKVVDFQQFRAERGRQRLPLLEQPEPALRELEPPRSLSDREVAHRERMLSHFKALGGGLR